MLIFQCKWRGRPGSRGARNASCARHLHWKMSIDLSRLLVASMGHHDPLDGLAAAWRVKATRHDFGGETDGLTEVIVDYRVLCEGVDSWTPHDALGLGGLLSTLAELIDLTASGRIPFDPLLLRLASDAERGFGNGPVPREIAAPLARRLPFRELGLAIGLRAVPAACEAVDHHATRFGGVADRAILRGALERLVQRVDLAGRIELAWLAPAAQSSTSWSMHADINSVMLAASLLGGSDAPHARRLLTRLSASP